MSPTPGPASCPRAASDHTLFGTERSQACHLRPLHMAQRRSCVNHSRRPDTRGPWQCMHERGLAPCPPGHDRFSPGRRSRREGAWLMGAATSPKHLPPTGEQPALRCAQAAKNQHIIDAGNLQSPAWISVLRNHLQEIICRVDCLPGVLADWRFSWQLSSDSGTSLGLGAPPWPQGTLTVCRELWNAQPDLVDIYGALQAAMA